MRSRSVLLVALFPALLAAVAGARSADEALRISTLFSAQEMAALANDAGRTEAVA